MTGGPPVPRKKLMSWTGAPAFRWRKTYQGKQYKVCCSDLKLSREDWTEERSLRAANDWWRHQLETLDVTAAQAPHAAAARRKAEYARAHGLEDEAKLWEYETEVLTDIRRAARMEPLSDPHDVEEVNRKLAIIRECGEEFSKALGQFLCSSDLSQKQLNTIFGYGEVWVDRLAREPVVPLDKKVGHWADRWAETLREEAAVGGRSKGGAKNRATMLGHFVAFLGRETAADTINEERWAEWLQRLLRWRHERDQDIAGKAGFSSDYCDALLKVSRQFLRFLLERRAVDRLPNNFAKRTHLLVDKGAPTIDPAQVKLAVDRAKGVMKLHLLLMANCGFTQMDIAQLGQNEVNWAAGTITRRRTKTKKAGGPKVTYQLWAQTRALLTRYRSDHPTLALLHTSGEVWVKDGGSDLIARAFAGLRKDCPAIQLSLKHIRKCSPQLLDSHRDHRHYSTLFLAHKPKGVKEKHYSANYSQDELNAAVRWLGQQYGFAGPDGA